MGVRYTPIDGELVSWEWGVALHDMREDGVWAVVREGKRTFARQLFFRLLYLSGRGNLAARPSHKAPHIRTGRIDHAIDFGNAAAAVRWLVAHGIAATLPVRDESWHVEAPADDLERYAAAHGNPGETVIRPYYTRPFRPNKRDAVKRLQRLLRDHGFLSVKTTGRYDRATRSAVGRFQHRRGAKVDRIVGPATWRALRAASNK